MISELHIANVGVVENATVELSGGMTVITGETGAGKTLLIGAIKMLLGERGDASMIRNGESEATVVGRFTNLAAIEREELVAKRVIATGGRGRAYLDGEPCAVGELKASLEDAMAIHGQNAHQLLMSPISQREALDEFGVINTSELEKLKSQRKALLERQSELGGDERTREHERDLLKFQVTEIEEAALTNADEEQQLGAEAEQLSNVVAYREGLALAVQALSDDDAALHQLSTAIAAIERFSEYAPQTSRMRAAQADLVDALRDLQVAQQQVEDDPQRLEAIGERRARLSQLRRKYGETLGDVIEFGASAAQRLHDLENRSELQHEIDALLQENASAIAAASRIARLAREKAAPKFADAITAHLRELAMPRAVITLSIAGDDGSQVVLHLQANSGEAAAPLAKAASGGELARTMLAIHLALLEVGDRASRDSSREPARTLVFDEVDAGIGGEAGVAVGRALARVAEQAQVLVITHLPQVAAFGDSHILVEKSDVKGRTVTQMRTLDSDMRIDEIARMLAGKSDSASARDHAAELLTSSMRSAAPTGSAKVEKSPAAKKTAGTSKTGAKKSTRVAKSS